MGALLTLSDTHVDQIAPPEFIKPRGDRAPLAHVPTANRFWIMVAHDAGPFFKRRRRKPKPLGGRRWAVKSEFCAWIDAHIRQRKIHRTGRHTVIALKLDLGALCLKTTDQICALIDPPTTVIANDDCLRKGRRRTDHSKGCDRDRGDLYWVSNISGPCAHTPCGNSPCKMHRHCSFP